MWFLGSAILASFSSFGIFVTLMHFSRQRSFCMLPYTLMLPIKQERGNLSNHSTTVVISMLKSSKSFLKLALV